MSNFFFLLLLCLPFSFLISVQSVTLPSDIAALQAFKSSIKPSSIPSYSCLAAWNFTSDPCAAPRVTHFTCGVICTAASSPARVTQLTLDPAGYSGTLSPLISKLTQLIVLDLSENNFFGPIPPSLSSLPNLQTLVLRSNSFSGSVPPSIGSLKSLQSLDLSRNYLSGSLPNTMNSLTSLRRLDLSFNKLTGSLPKLPPNLLELAIKANSLSGSLYKIILRWVNSTRGRRTQRKLAIRSTRRLVLPPTFTATSGPSQQQLDTSRDMETHKRQHRPRRR